MKRVYPMEIEIEPYPFPRQRRVSLLRRTWVAIPILLVLFFVLRPAWRQAENANPNTRGTITSTGESGNWTTHVSTCGSGQPYSYFGVRLADSHAKELAARIVLPETGEAHVTASIPGTNQEMNFPRSLCSAWDVDVQPTHTIYDSVRELRGHAKFACEVPDGIGGHITGDVTFDSCA